MRSNGWLIVEASDEQLNKFHPDRESFFYSTGDSQRQIKGTDFLDTALKNLGFNLEMSINFGKGQRKLYTFKGDFMMVLKFMYDLSMNVNNAGIKMYGLGVNVFSGENADDFEIIYVDTTKTKIKMNMSYTYDKGNMSDVIIINDINNRLHIKEKTMMALTGSVDAQTFHKIDRFINKGKNNA